MTEIRVRQRSEEWFELRGCVALTASRFGEVLGVGRGRPYDFLRSLVLADQHTDQDSSVSTLGRTYNEFGHKEHTAITSSFFRTEIIDCNV